MHEQLDSAHRDISNWKDSVQRMESEAKDLRKLIEELEYQKKRLNDRLYEYMNDQANQYKERTMQAL